MIISYRLFCKILIMSVIGVFLFGCFEITPSPDQMDKSTFTGIPCAAPCWHGLVIGNSSEGDVMATLSTLTFIDQNTTYVYRMSMSGLDPNIESPGAEITANCIRPRQECLKIRVVDDVLVEIEVVLNYEINLEEAIGYLGNPDYIGYRNLGGERILCEVDIVWSNKQLVLASKIFDGYDAVENNCGVVRDTGKTMSSLILSKARYKSFTAIDSMLSSDAGKFLKFSGTIQEK